MFVSVNGVDLFFEKSGAGKPIILLHGNSEDHTKFDSLSEMLAANYTVYALDSRGHGQSSKTDTISYKDLMEDVAAFIKKLEIERPILLGFSDGAIIGLLLSSEYPDILSALISCGANTHPEQLRKWFIVLTKFGYFSTKDPKMRMMFTEPCIPADDLRKIKVPTLVIAGSRDILPERYTREIAKNIPGSECLILPGETHSSYIKHSRRLYAAIGPFLAGIANRGI